HVASQDQEVGPGDLFAVLLFDGPEKPAGLVQVDVVGPAVEGRKTLLAALGPAAAVAGAVGAGAVPRHADEEGPVMAEIRRPPLLGVGHELLEVFLELPIVKLLKLLGVVE